MKIYRQLLTGMLGVALMLSATFSFAAPLFVEDFSNGLDTTKWNVINPTGVSVFTDKLDGQKSVKLVGHKSAIATVQSFVRGHNLKCTFEVWSTTATMGLYAPFRSNNNWSATGSSGSQGLFNIVGGVCGTVNAPTSDSKTTNQWASWQENNVSTWGGSPGGPQDGVMLADNYNNAWNTSCAADNGDSSPAQRMKIVVELGDVSGGTGWFGNEASATLTQFTVNALAQTTATLNVGGNHAIDTRGIPVGQWIGTGSTYPAIAIYGRNPKQPCFDTVNGTSPVYVGFCMGDSEGGIYVTNIKVENDLNTGPVPVTLSKMKTE
jgi:hypothetical protein